MYSSSGAVAVGNAAFGPGTGAIVRSAVDCRGNEMALSFCRFSLPDNRRHSSDAGIRCHPGEAIFLLCS